MKFGFCAGMDKWDILKSLGYDYIELGVGEVIPHQNEEAFIKKKEIFEKVGLHCMAFNGFIPGDFSIIRGYLDGDFSVLDYAKKAIRRIAEIGGKVIVLGSGGARRVPEGMDKNAALEQFAKFARDCGEYAEDYGVIIAIEHLNKKECNLINSVQEAFQLVKKVNHPNVRLLVDTYHMLVENESVEVLKGFTEYISHVHIADGQDRSYPHKDIAFYERLGEILKDAGYQGGISVEAPVKDFGLDARNSIEVMQKIFN